MAREGTKLPLGAMSVALMPSKLTYVSLSTCIQHSGGTYGVFKQDRNFVQQVVIGSPPEKTTQTQSVEKRKYFSQLAGTILRYSGSKHRPKCLK